MRYSVGFQLSKQFTAAAILMLQQEGKLTSLGDDPKLANTSPARRAAIAKSAHPPDPFPHLRLSGLLARGLRHDHHA